MKLLTPDRFRQRHAELVDLRQKADADYRRANLESAMGTGSEADVLKAKQALDLLVGQLEGLEAARVESNRLQEAETKRARQAAYAKLAEDVERMLAEREATIARIEAKALDLGEEIAAYAALTLQLRSAASTYRPHYHVAGMVPHVSQSEMTAVLDAFERHTLLLPLVVATITNDQLVLGGKSLPDIEASESEKARSRVERVAPKREMA